MNNILKYPIKLIVFNTLLLVLMVLGCKDKKDPEPDDPTLSFKIKVKDEKTDAIIDSAKVKISPKPLSSDAILFTNLKGEITFKGKAQEYQLEISHQNYETKKVTFGANSNQLEDEFSLKPKPPKIKLSKTDIDFGSKSRQFVLTISNEGGEELDWEIIEDYNWLNFNPSSGKTKGGKSTNLNITVDDKELNQGDHKASIIVKYNEGEPKQIDISISVVSKLSVTPTDLIMGYNKNSETFTIRNTESGTLPFSIETDKNWLTVTPNKGAISKSPVPITVEVDRTGLPFGNQSPGKIFINSDGGNEIITVQMIVPDPNAAIIDISPSVVNFSTNSDEEEIIIKNAGKKLLDWSVSKTSSWLTLSKNSGDLADGIDEKITFSLNREGLASGKYEDILKFKSNGGDLDVKVYMEISSAPVLSFSPAELNFGRNGTQLSFKVTNVGNGDMSWTVKPNQDWLSVSPQGGNNTGTINVTVNRENLSYREYSGEIKINAGEGGEGTLRVFMTHGAPNQAPTAHFSINPESGDISTDFTFDASEITDDYDNPDSLEVRWKWEEGNSFTDWSIEKKVTHQYSTIGDKTITMEVRDSDGASNSIDKNLTVDELSEKEPNNNRESAQILAANSAILGRVGYDNDSEDWYKITPTENGTLQFIVSNLQQQGVSNSDLDDIYLYDKDFNKITSIGYSYIQPDETASSYIVPISGNQDYFIKISPLKSTYKTPYKLTIQYSQLTIQDSNEDNDNYSNAKEIFDNEILTATIAFKGDTEDWYYYIPKENGTIKLDLENNHQKDVRSGRIASIAVYDEELNKLITPSYISPSYSNSTYPLTVQANQKHYIKVGKYYDDYGSPYTLTINFKDNLWGDDYENNNTQGSSHLIELNATIQALIGYDGDTEDWYSVTAQETGTVSFNIENRNDKNTLFGGVGRMYLYNQNLQELTYANYTSPNYTNTTYPISLDKGDKVSLVIKPYDKNHKAPYLLKSTFHKIDISDVGEVNNTKTNASILNVNNSYNLSIGYDGDDEDWYKLTIPGDGIFNAEIYNKHLKSTLYGHLGEISFISNNLLEYAETRSISPTYDYIPYNKSVSKGDEIHIKVSSYNDLHQAPYQLKTNFTEYSFTDNFEPNNTQQQASLVTVNAVIDGTIGYTSDNSDWYSIKPEENGIFKFKVYNLHQSGITYGDIGNVILYDSNLTKLKEITNGYLDDGENRESSSIEIEGGQQYYLFIEPESGDHAIPYKVELTFQKS